MCMNEFNNYAERGSFEYTGGDNNWNRLVNSVVTKKQKGVYCMKVGDEIVYIGKGGSVYQDGSWGVRVIHLIEDGPSPRRISGGQ